MRLQAHTHVAASLRDAHPGLGETGPRERALTPPFCRRRRGFTLVEMLLASALCIVLLGALWMLMSTYGELFDKGQMQVESVQLCRSLLEQLADDLRSAIQDPLPGPTDEADGAVQRRRFGLYGSSRELRFDVLQLTPHQGNLVPVGRAGGRAEETRTARVPELRTVHYAFLEPAGDDASPESGRRGLVRTELDFETPLDPDAAPGDVEDPEAVDEPIVADDDTRLWVPEVASLQFRYFDGRGWSDSWNSLERKALPAAVAIQIQLADLRHRPLRGRTDGDLNGEIGRADAADDDDLGALAAEPAASPGGATYRLVVDLPNSPNYRPPPPEPRPDTLVRPTVRTPAPRIAPPRFAPSAAPAPLPEDWIRTGRP